VELRFGGMLETAVSHSFSPNNLHSEVYPLAQGLILGGTTVTVSKGLCWLRGPKCISLSALGVETHPNRKDRPCRKPVESETREQTLRRTGLFDPKKQRIGVTASLRKTMSHETRVFANMTH